MIGVGRSRIQDRVAVAVAVAVGGGGAVAVAVAGLTKIFFNHIQKDFLIYVWGYRQCASGGAEDGATILAFPDWG